MSPSIDFLIAWFLLSLTGLTVFHSYHFGGDVCADRHSITYRDVHGETVKKPGWLSEVFVYLILISALLATDGTMSSIEIARSDWGPLTALGVFSVLALYLRRQTGQLVTELLTEPQEKKYENFEEKIRASYRYYWLHAAMIYFVAIMCVIKLCSFMLSRHLGVDRRRKLINC